MHLGTVTWPRIACAKSSYRATCTWYCTPSADLPGMQAATFMLLTSLPGDGCRCRAAVKAKLRKEPNGCFGSDMPLAGPAGASESRRSISAGISSTQVSTGLNIAPVITSQISLAAAPCALQHTSCETGGVVVVVCDAAESVEGSR